MSAIHYYASTQRTFRQAVIHLLENEYKLVGSRKVLEMIADDIAHLQADYYRGADQVPPGHIVWRGTLDPGHKLPANLRAEEEPTVTAVLPLVTAEDIAEAAQGCPRGQTATQWAHQRDIRRIARLVKAGWNNPGGRLLLSQAELSLLANRAIGTVRRCITDYLEQTGELLPIKGYVLDQGSKPTHKRVILRLYEKGMAPPDIAQRTNHSLQAVDHYIKDYERVKVLLGKGLSVTEISQAVGKGVQTVLQYQKIIHQFHPHLVSADQLEG
jgi:hypothetical protein